MNVRDRLRRLVRIGLELEGALLGLDHHRSIGQRSGRQLVLRGRNDAGSLHTPTRPTKKIRSHDINLTLPTRVTSTRSHTVISTQSLTTRVHRPAHILPPRDEILVHERPPLLLRCVLIQRLLGVLRRSRLHPTEAICRCGARECPRRCFHRLLKREDHHQVGGLASQRRAT